jgi:hypothetical protein
MEFPLTRSQLIGSPGPTNWTVGWSLRAEVPVIPVGQDGLANLDKIVDWFWPAVQ